MTSDEIIPYIGLPWISGQRNCWLFFREVQRRHYGLDLPIVEIDDLSRREIVKAIEGNGVIKSWVQIPKPEDGCAVLMGRRERPTHIGMFLDRDGGRYLHCVENLGVVYQTKYQLQLDGWSFLTYWRHKSRM